MIKFLEHPQDAVCKPGERVEFSIKTDPIVTSYSWNFENVPISADDQGYEGSETNLLVIKECQSKHIGVYNCTVSKENGDGFTSHNAMLKISK